MASLDLERVKTYRAKVFGLPPYPKLKTLTDAIEFVNQRGYAYFWPIKGVDMPSIWVATAGDRPVPNEHDDPGHVTWRWKDEALGKRVWYYGKILRRKATIVSLEQAPYFYALTENYGSPEEDHLVAYQEGRLTQAAKLVYEALLDEGPLDSISLRRAAGMLNAKSSEFSRALEMLQADFKIMPIGISPAGAWKYAFIYDVTARFMPDLPRKARSLGEAEARCKLATNYFQLVGLAQERDVLRLFGWGPEVTKRVLKGLLKDGFLTGGLEYARRKGEWLALKELLLEK
ncbi:MAG: winged helix DNA-binding domain-containing protein [Anaerolineales bacterium]|nr:winged helix DNA-binding domain-containing protein [Anaerolineales bacterium]